MTDVGIGETFYSGYRTVDQIQQDLRTLADQSALATLIDYGDSYAKTVGGVVTPDGKRCGGYDLLALKITSGESAKPPFVVVSGLHAHEIMIAEIVLRFARHLVHNYATDSAVATVVDGRDIYIIPCGNPDALWVVGQGGASPRPQRKNVNPTNGTGTWLPTLDNHTGVDLNRNFGFKWDASVSASNTSTTPSSKYYKGPSAASEPESAALQTWLATILSDQRGPLDTDAAPSDTEGLVISVHQNAAQGNECVFPWAWTTTNSPNHAALAALATRLAALMSYDSGQFADHLGYTVSGEFCDWVYGTFGVPALLFEGLLFEGSTLTPYADVVTEWPAHRDMLMDAALVASSPYDLP